MGNRAQEELTSRERGAKFGEGREGEGGKKEKGISGWNDKGINISKHMPRKRQITGTNKCHTKMSTHTFWEKSRSLWRLLQYKKGKGEWIINIFIMFLYTQPRFHASMFRTISTNDIEAANVIRDTKENDAKSEILVSIIMLIPVKTSGTQEILKETGSTGSILRRVETL